MNPKYEIGQKVVLRQNKSQSLLSRDCTIEPYVGQVGQVSDYYWISPRGGEVFYIYIVRVGAGYTEVTLHEDEIEAYIE